MKKPAKRNPHAIIVLGMHRSGTSALMRVINLRGVDLGSNLMPPAPNFNEKGFWERMDIYRLNEKLLEDLNSSWDDVRSLPEGWWESEAAQRYKLEIINILERDFAKSRFWGVKDPRICRFLPVWRPLLEQIGCKPYFLIIVRNPLEVVSSLAKRDGFSQGKSCLLWLKHIIESEKGTRNTPRLFVTYEELLSDWKGLMSRAQKSFQFKWPVALKDASPEIASFLQKSLRHNIINDTVLIEDNTLSRWIKDLYFETKGAVNGNDSQLIKAVTAIEAKLKNASGLYESALADIWARYQANHVMLQERSQELDDIKIRLKGSSQDKGYHLSTIDSLQKAIKEKNEHIQQLGADLTDLRNKFTSSLETGSAREARFANLQSKVKEGEERIQQLDAEVVELRDQLSKVQQTVVGRETEVTHLQTGIKDRDVRIQQLDSELTDLRSKFTSSQEAASARDAQFANLQSKVKEREERIQQLDTEVVELRDRLSEVQQTVVRRETEATHLQTGIKDRDGRIHELDIDLVDLREAFSALQGTVANHTAEITHLQADLEDRDDHIKQLNAESADLRKELIASQEVVAKYGSTVDQLQTEIKERDERIQQLNAELSGLREETTASQEALSARETEVKNFHIEIVDKDKRIHELDADPGRLQDEADSMRTQVENYRLELNAISGSKSWKLTAPLRRVSAIFGKVKRKIKTIRYLLNRQYRLINKSGLFDSAYYLEQIPDLAESELNPLAHYIRYGAAEGRDPNPLFDTSYYLEQNPDIAESELNPLAHYIRYGAAEGRDPNPLFDTSYYLEQNPDIAESELNPLVHYIRYGAAESRDPNPLFDTPYYLEQNPDIAESGINPLTHYLMFGAGEGRDPNPLFDTSYYLEQNPEIAESGMNPLAHYHRFGADEVGGLFARPSAPAPSPESEALPQLSPATSTDPKLVAFYLPQFHPTPENNEFWGKGFTEWTSVTRGRVLFRGHYQPRLPADLGFYDLRMPEVREAQAELARAHGIHAFCYYYYWFDRRRLLHRPLDEVLVSGRPDFPFCICWANESWSRRWDGSDTEILIPQCYEEGFAERFAEDVIPILRDPRYLRVEGRPLLVVYRLDKIPDPQEAIATWRRIFREKSGVGDVLLAAVECFGSTNPISEGFDVAIEFPPHNPLPDEHRSADPRDLVDDLDSKFCGHLRDYRKCVRSRSALQPPGYPRFRGIMPSWDNTARRDRHAMIYAHASPALYKNWLSAVLRSAADHSSPYPPLVFIDAWNEWAEGAYIEPDQKHGSAYLQATAAALEHFRNSSVREGQLRRGYTDLFDIRRESSDTPEISIVIPVFNGVELTLDCLRTLRDHKSAFIFEIIVADDGSTDLTERLVGAIPWVRYMRQPHNRSFGAICNMGAKRAWGKYLVFLNNDTAVCEGWLDALRETFDTWPRAGLVGSKIVLKDGVLQECGGLVFRDGSVASYGRGDDPNDPHCCYSREVDYVSGAAMMIRRSVFMKLKGFDALYEPGYYESADLAFRVREQDLQVIVNPHAVILHHEGGTAGLGIQPGVKRYQVINRDKFLQRWETTLRDYPESSDGVAELVGDTPRILVIDCIVPRPDHDSGSLRMAGILKALRDLGCHVTFASEDLSCREAYERPLERIGVEILRRPYLVSLEQYLDERGSSFNYVLLSRREPTALHIDAVRRHCTNARIIYDTCDLHFIREEREAKLFRRNCAQQELNAKKTLELNLIQRSDMTLVVSPEEQTVLLEQIPGKDVRILPNIHELRPTPRPFADRDGILFIGFFLHTPNVDAVLWFAQEVLPVLDREGFRPVFHIVGSDPPHNVQALASEQIRIHNFVPNVDPIFDSCRLSVAPVRFGAGVKGKINQSLSLGVPCVTTNVGAEGTYIKNGVDGLVADEPAEFATCIHAAYHDEDLWQRLREGGLRNIETHFSLDVAKSVLRELIVEKTED